MIHLTEHHHLPQDNTSSNRVLANAAGHPPSLTHEALTVWHHHLGRHHTLRLLTLEKEGTSIGLAPLCLVRGPAGLRTLTFAGAFDYLDFAFTPDLPDLPEPALTRVVPSPSPPAQGQALSRGRRVSETLRRAQGRLSEV